MSPFQQHPNHPPRHHDAVRSMARYAGVVMCITGLAALGLTLGTAYGNSPPLLAAAACAVFILFGVLGGLGGLYDTWRHVRIIPYFRRTVGETDTFLAGRGLARSLAQLDTVAVGCGVTPLSSFGFNDDLCNEPLTWHSPADGLHSVSAILKAIDAKSDSPGKWTAVIQDLQKLEFALKRAAEQEIPFCLLLRHGNSTSGHEWSIRQGTAF